LSPAQARNCTTSLSTPLPQVSFPPPRTQTKGKKRAFLSRKISSRPTSFFRKILATFQSGESSSSIAPPFCAQCKPPGRCGKGFSPVFFSPPSTEERPPNRSHSDLFEVSPFRSPHKRNFFLPVWFSPPHHESIHVSEEEHGSASVSLPSLLCEQKKQVFDGSKLRPALPSIPPACHGEGAKSVRPGEHATSTFCARSGFTSDRPSGGFSFLPFFSVRWKLSAMDKQTARSTTKKE